MPLTTQYSIDLFISSCVTGPYDKDGEIFVANGEVVIQLTLGVLSIISDRHVQGKEIPAINDP